MTVSNVLRHRTGRLSEETRQRVLQALQELSYIPVRPAMQNRHVTTHVLGVVFFHGLQAFVEQRTLWGMSEQARERNHDLLIVLRPQPDWLAPDGGARFLDRRCDGYILVGGHEPALSAMLAAKNVPVLECYSVHPPPGVARVVVDDRGAMRQAVEALWDLGHRRIGHLGGPPGNGEADLRCQAFCEAMRERGAEDGYVARSRAWAGPEAQRPAEALLAMPATAIVCANDGLALDAWQVAAENGRRVPEDLSLTGMDNTGEGERCGLTTLAASFEDVGRAAVDVLLSRIYEKEATTCPIVPAHLIRRSSIAPARVGANEQ